MGIKEYRLTSKEEPSDETLHELMSQVENLFAVVQKILIVFCSKNIGNDSTYTQSKAQERILIRGKHSVGNIYI